MAKRYSNRRSDGTVVYYDTETEMQADMPEYGLFDFSAFWAVIGFVVFILIGCAVIYNVEATSSWPKWLRFSSVLTLGAIGAYAIGRLGQSLLYLFWSAVLIGILFAVGSAIWHFV